MGSYRIISALFLLSSAHSQVIFHKNSTGKFATCTNPDDATCADPEIYRCRNNIARPNYCHLMLDLAPESSMDVSCWEDSVPGKAKCVADCVAVVALNGSTVYPAGCSYQKFNVTGPPSSISLDRPTSTMFQENSPSSTATITGGAVAQVSTAAASSIYDGMLSALGIGVVALLL